jgi:hypothetical protein
MRRINYNIAILSLLTIFLVLYSSCSRNEKSGLQREAEQQAQVWWDTNITLCRRDEAYLRVKWRNYFRNMAVDHDVLFHFHPIKSRPFTVEETVTTPANRLNGIDWQGRIDVLVLVYRYYDYSLAKWSEWIDGHPLAESFPIGGYGSPLIGAELRKMHGRWLIGGDSRNGLSYMKTDCSEIPE